MTMADPMMMSVASALAGKAAEAAAGLHLGNITGPHPI
jgi:hypothetical protein